MDADASRLLHDIETGLALALDPQRTVPDEPSVLRDAARRLALAPGAKRVRPRLVALFGQAVGAPRDALVDLAVAAELIHAGSLLHDDVVDEGTLRRGQPTANAAWGNLVAVLAGDLCLTLAFVAIRGRAQVLTEEAVDTIATMTRATMVEAESRGRLDLTAERWRSIVEGKTGSLFAWCGRGAAHVAGAREAAERFGRAGLHLGVAFQLADDLLDLTGGAPKDRFSDIRNQAPTWPLLRAARVSSAVRALLLGAWSRDQVAPDEARAIGAAVLATGVAAETADRVRAEGRAAIEALGAHAGEPGCRELAVWASLLAASVDRAARESGPAIPADLAMEAPALPSLDRARS